MFRRDLQLGRPGRRTVLRVSALAVGAALALGACGGSGSDSGKTTVTFWNTNAGPSFTPLWQHIIAEFEKDNPNIDIEITDIPHAQVQQKIDTAIASDATPDVAQLNTSLVASTAGQKALEPLDDRLSGSPLNGKLAPNFLTLVKGATADGKLYSLPYSGNVGVVWYRTDWFKEADLKLETWDDFYTAAERLTDPGKDRFGFTIRGGAGSIAQALEMVYGQSGVTEFWTPDGRTTVNDPRNVAALTRLVGLFGKYTPKADVSNDYAKMVAQFDGGTIGMMQHNLGSYGDHTEALGGPDKVVGTTVPASPSGTRVIVSNPVTGMVVFRSSEHKDAAWKFAEFVASKESCSHWNENVGQIPVNTDSAAEPWVEENPTLANATETMADPATKIVQLPYYLPEFAAISKTDTEPLFQKVLLGDMTPKAFLDEMAGMFNEAQAGFEERQGD
ncbi:sugar-binding protein [Actinomadura sp. CNU-125]|uniref:ABC transporter substrate-binding protein n=1 Tax=Actinomadura sp. CNU-125 TaxID=1904961 RepID=UPI000960BA04|nr:sugar ABC transporter substrate-binding protein [Actinomadura sp. CNU-125]OLT38019.1 sugar-binding protein [Actinomadura sp. CNU-125]